MNSASMDGNALPCLVKDEVGINEQGANPVDS
jgi:hypothetical protein